jgi:hypothetical protein
LEKFYYQSEITIFTREYHVVRDFKKFTIFSELVQILLEKIKHSAEWDYPLDYLKNKEEWSFVGTMTKDLLRIVFNFYEFYDKLSLSFPSESYVRNNLEIINISLYKRGGTQILNDEGEVIGVNEIQEDYFNFKNIKHFPS